ncbi:APC family permease [Janibacter sp. GS2]|uniref:APC family permease n=1 Tax=Janibacter sp. GS2 TaxID=3442646 RepID=UPI003EC06B47
MTNSSGAAARTSDRRLGLRDGVGIGLGTMLGAGLFTTFAPAAARAGTLLLLAVTLAALVAGASAHSMVRLAARHPGSGGVYLYGRERMGLPWGYLAGWAFVVGKTASCAAMALALGLHLWPDHATPVAVLSVLAVLALNLQGVREPHVVAMGVLLLVVVLTLAFVLVMLIAPPVTAEAPPPAPPESGGVLGVVQAAGFLFFAFAGFARLVPFGEQVEHPRRTIPRAITIALAIVLALYLLVALALTHTLGAGWVAAREAPLAEAAEISVWPWLGPALRIGAVLVIGGALMALTGGISRIVLAMARDHHLPSALGTVDRRSGVPRRAEAVIAAAVIIIVMLVDVQGAIGYASFLALSYYAIGHACAWTLDRPVVHKVVPTLGLLACIIIAVLLPWQSVVAGVVTLALGSFTGWARWTTREDRPT